MLQEFYSAATRKLGIEPFQARRLVQDFRIFDIVQVTPEIIGEGIDVSILNTISFWDGLIVASALTARCSEILSEDLANGQIIQGVAGRNPVRWTRLGKGQELKLGIGIQAGTSRSRTSAGMPRPRWRERIMPMLSGRLRLRISETRFFPGKNFSKSFCRSPS